MTSDPTARTESRLVRPALALLYAGIVLEILFMISPFALYFYSLYGPVLNFTHRSAATSWLSGFFLPHFSHTTHPLLELQKPLAGVLIVTGGALFLVAFAQIYTAKLRRKPEVTSLLYRHIRHPQYLALAVLGAGTLLLWPRFSVLIGFVVMLIVYSALARFEESNCVARFGDGYRDYLERSGRFLPHAIERRLDFVLGPINRLSWRPRLAVQIAAGVAVVLLALLAQSWSLGQVSHEFRPRVAALSPAVLDAATIRQSLDIALADPSGQELVAAAETGAGILAYVLPESWFLADLPAERWEGQGGHVTPSGFDPRHFKVLLTQARTHRPQAQGRDIVLKSYGRSPRRLLHVDLERGVVTKSVEPPEHVLWGDIPTPLF